MNYEIIGGDLPAVVCHLNNNEAMICEGGAMSWMSPNMEMATSSNGGLGKAFGRAFSGESMFQNIYTARNGEGMIAFASSFPGSIIPLEIKPGVEYIVQKDGFLAATKGVNLSVAFQRKLGAGLFGGEGFIMERISGEGTAFIEIDGAVVEYELQKGEQMVLDTGYLAMMEASCKMDIVSVKGAKNILLGGEGLFNTVVTGPGKIIVQTLPTSKLAYCITKYISTGK